MIENSMSTEAQAKTVSEPETDQGASPIVGIIMGSESDLPIMIEAIEVLKALSIPHSVNFVSAHRTPTKMVDYATTARDRGLKVIIAGAGGSAHLPGMTASETLVPVISVPILGKNSGLDGLDALLSEVQMPPGVPVAVMAINGARNAGLFAAQILANEDPELSQRLEAFRKSMRDEVAAKDVTLQALGPRRYLDQTPRRN